MRLECKAGEEGGELGSLLGARVRAVTSLGLVRYNVSVPHCVCVRWEGAYSSASTSRYRSNRFILAMFLSVCGIDVSSLSNLDRNMGDRFWF